MKNPKVNTPSAMKAKATTVEVLERVAGAEEPYCAVVSKREFRIFDELIRSDYIDGNVGPLTHDDSETSVRNIVLTTNGRLLMERLRSEAEGKKPVAKVKRWSERILIYLAGIASTLAGAYLKSRLGL